VALAAITGAEIDAAVIAEIAVTNSSLRIFSTLTGLIAIRTTFFRITLLFYYVASVLL
jgi:hypothetical protein